MPESHSKSFIGVVDNMIYIMGGWRATTPCNCRPRFNQSARQQYRVNTSNRGVSPGFGGGQQVATQTTPRDSPDIAAGGPVLPAAGGCTR